MSGQGSHPSRIRPQLHEVVLPDASSFGWTLGKETPEAQHSCAVLEHMPVVLIADGNDLALKELFELFFGLGRDQFPVFACRSARVRAFGLAAPGFAAAAGFLSGLLAGAFFSGVAPKCRPLPV